MINSALYPSSYTQIRYNILFAKLLYTSRYRVRCLLTLENPEFSSNISGLRSNDDVRAPRLVPTIWLLSVLYSSTSLTQVGPFLYSIAPELFISPRVSQSTQFSPWATRVLEHLSIHISGIYPSDTSRW